ncbi:MAG: hypothetical protein JWR57_182, partial [Mycetocola sp.]|jgi:hypothetical protein|nr:hypothetical protein [Mycetocola sp.]
MTHAAAGARRNLVVLLSVIAVLVIVSFVVVFSRGEAELLDESTPEGVVQRYAAAVLDGDDDTAIEYLSERTQEQCGTVQDTHGDDLRVTLISSDLRDDTADVRVQLSRHSGGPFGSDYSYEEGFRLAKENSGWRIESVPWDLTVCTMDGEIR